MANINPISTSTRMTLNLGIVGEKQIKKNKHEYFSVSANFTHAYTSLMRSEAKSKNYILSNYSFFAILNNTSERSLYAYVFSIVTHIPLLLKALNNELNYVKIR